MLFYFLTFIFDLLNIKCNNLLQILNIGNPKICSMFSWYMLVKTNISFLPISVSDFTLGIESKVELIAPKFEYNLYTALVHWNCWLSRILLVANIFSKIIRIHWKPMFRNATFGTTLCSTFPSFLLPPLLPSDPRYRWLVVTSAASTNEKHYDLCLGIEFKIVVPLGVRPLIM
jgi:hypothetical protein